MEAQDLHEPERYFLVCGPLVQALNTGVVIDGQLLFPSISMYITDQAEDRAMLALKGPDTYMEYSLCTLPLRISQPQNDRSNLLSPFGPGVC